MSSETPCANHGRRKSKVSDARSVRVGLVGPKARLESVADGQPVNIPVPDRGAGQRGLRERQPPDGVAVASGENP